MTEEFPSIERLAWNIKNKLDTTTQKKRVIALYAFNATGKTRLSNLLSGTDANGEQTEEETETPNEGIKTLCYNAFLEDMFTWDNENFILKFDPSYWIIKLVVDQGLETNIINNFKDITDSNGFKLEPSFDFTNWEVTFKIASGDNMSASNIKISKGEESVFIWSVFYTILETAISELILIEENRSTDVFNNLEYIILDDPVSSIDDTRIISLAVRIANLIKNDHISDKLDDKKEELEKQEFTSEYIETSLTEFKSENYTELKLKFLITTHHALYYNVLVNSFKRDNNINFKSYSLSKDNQIFSLSDQGDSPFSYHLSVKELIQNAMDSDNLEKYHFNLFRNLLEKTSNFLWYNDRSECLSWNNKQEFIRLLNIYSHSRLSDLESRELSVQDKNIFQETFSDFIQNFNWHIDSDD